MFLTFVVSTFRSNTLLFFIRMVTSSISISSWSCHFISVCKTHLTWYYVIITIIEPNYMTTWYKNSLVSIQNGAWFCDCILSLEHFSILVSLHLSNHWYWPCVWASTSSDYATISIFWFSQGFHLWSKFHIEGVFFKG
mgnify:CR=1 FL=1